MGAKRMTLKPLYATNMRKQSAARQTMKLMKFSSKSVWTVPGMLMNE
jgi:hypothetical protein